jgi:transposase
MPRLERIWADSAYAGEKLRSWCAEHIGWQLKVVPRNSDNSTFEVIPRRWVVERSIAWIRRNRRLVNDYERKVQTSECWLKVAMIRRMLKRLGKIEQHAHILQQRVVQTRIFALPRVVRVGCRRS